MKGNSDYSRSIEVVLLGISVEMTIWDSMKSTKLLIGKFLKQFTRLQLGYTGFCRYRVSLFLVWCKSFTIILFDCHWNFIEWPIESLFTNMTFSILYFVKKWTLIKPRFKLNLICYSLQ